MRTRKINLDIFPLLRELRARKPLVHHLTNWVTIYDCANVVKTLGGSPVMAHAPEEVAEMAGISGALVLNIGTLTSDFIKAMRIAAASANKKGIPVVLDCCGAGATRMRDRACAELLDKVRIDVIKGNASEIARVAGRQAVTKGVDATEVSGDMSALARALAKRRECVVVITGAEDIVHGNGKTYYIRNGVPLMADIVGTGCMASSVIGSFAAVGKDLALAAAAGLVCLEIAAELAAEKAGGTGSFKEILFDRLYKLDKATINRRQRVFS